MADVSVKQLGHTQTIQIVMQPFMSRFRWESARIVGRPPLRGEGGGILSVLYVSQTFVNAITTRRAGTRSDMLASV